jgi:hypothetical protein
MERTYVCPNGHPFRVTDETDKPPTPNTHEVYFGVTCPQCGSIYEINWPSGRTFKVKTLSTQS